MAVLLSFAAPSTCISISFCVSVPPTDGRPRPITIKIKATQLGRHRIQIVVPVSSIGRSVLMTEAHAIRACATPQAVLDLASVVSIKTICSRPLCNGNTTSLLTLVVVAVSVSAGDGSETIVLLAAMVDTEGSLGAGCFQVTLVSSACVLEAISGTCILKLGDMFQTP